MSVFSFMLATILLFLNALGGFGTAGESGGPAWDNDAYAQKVESRGKILKILTLGVLPPPRFEMTWDPIFQEAWDALEESNGFSMSKVSMLMPDFFFFVRWLTTAFPFVFYPIRDVVDDESYVGAMVASPTAVHWEAIPVAENEYEYYARFFYQDGSTRSRRIWSTYNTETGLIGSDRGFGTTGFNYNVKDQLLYSLENSFQRSLGYTKLYDDIALNLGSLTNIDTVRLYFDYDGKEWLIQFWKGRYFNMPGAEVGCYYKPPRGFLDRVLPFYDVVADEDFIGMSLKLTDIENEDELMYFPLRPHWWYAGFAARKKVSAAKEMLFETTLVPVSAEQYEAIRGALDSEVEKGTISYTEADTELGPGFHVLW